MIDLATNYFLEANMDFPWPFGTKSRPGSLS